MRWGGGAGQRAQATGERWVVNGTGRDGTQEVFGSRGERAGIVG